VKRTSQTNVDGEITDTWSEIATAWAAINPLEGRELWTAQQHYADVTHQIYIRYESRLADLDAKHRITWGSRVFDIAYVLKVDEENYEMTLLAKEMNQ
jgi:SPP1 family predicted phage head-tail adaptor